QNSDPLGQPQQGSANESSGTELRASEPAPGRVLVIDDQAEVRRALGAVLRRRGNHEVMEVGSVRDAIEALKSGDFELVLSDVHMPDLDGVDLLKVLRDQDPDLPVLLVSGSPDLDTAMKAVEFGAFEYLMKPVENDKLLASVVRGIETRRARLESKRELA